MRVTFLLVVLAISQSALQTDFPVVRDAEAYAVYSASLRGARPERWKAPAPVIIQETTESYGPPDCIPARIASEWLDVIADYRRQNSKTWRIEPRLAIELPFRLASKESILAPLHEQGSANWPAFDREYPGSGGYYVMSAVGFNTSKNRALISLGHPCGGFCGGHGLYLFEKIDGVWSRPKSIEGCQVIS